MHTTCLWTDIVRCARAEPQRQAKPNSSYRANDGDDVSAAKRSHRQSLQGAASGMHDEHLQKSSQAFNKASVAAKKRKAADARQQKMLHDSVQFEASSVHHLPKKLKAQPHTEARDSKKAPKAPARGRLTGKGKQAHISRGQGKEADSSESQEDDTELDEEEPYAVQKKLKAQFTSAARDTKQVRTRRSRGTGKEADFSGQDNADVDDEEQCEDEEQHLRLRKSHRRRAVGAQPQELDALEEEGSAVQDKDDDGRRGGAASQSGKGSRQTGARAASKRMSADPCGHKAYTPSPLRTHAGTQSPNNLVSSGDDEDALEHDEDASELNDSADDDTGSSDDVIRLPKTVTLDPLFGPCVEGQINMDFGSSLGAHGNWVCASVVNCVNFNAHAVPDERTVWQHKILSPGRSTGTAWVSHQVSPAVEERIARTVHRFNRKYPCATIQGVLPLCEVVESKVSSCAHRHYMNGVNACV